MAVKGFRDRSVFNYRPLDSKGNLHFYFIAAIQRRILVATAFQYLCIILNDRKQT